MAHILRCWAGFDDKRVTSPSRFTNHSGTAPTLDATIVSYSRWSITWDGIAAAVTGFLGMEPLGFLTSGLPDSATADYIRSSFHFYIGALPNAGTIYRLIGCNRSGNGTSYANLKEDGKIDVFNFNAGTAATSTGVLSVGTWYVGTFFINRSGQLRFIARSRDTGVTVLDITHGTNLGADSWIDVKIGPEAASRGQVYFDNWVIEGDNTQANIDDPVNLLTTRYTIGLLMPISDGFYNAWSGSYADVDEVPHDDGTTYREGTVNGQMFTQGLQSITSLVAQPTIIHGIEAFAYDDCTAGAGSGSVQLRVRSGTTDSDGTDASINESSGIVAIQRVLTTDPFGSGPWLTSSLNSVQVGLERISTNHHRCTQVGVELLYTIGDIVRESKIDFFYDVYGQKSKVVDISGRELSLEEVHANAFMQMLGTALPTPSIPDDLNLRPDVGYLQGTEFEQVLEDDDSLRMSLSTQLSAEDFGDLLVAKLALASGVGI